MRYLTALGLLAAALMGGCTWVTPSPEAVGKKIAVVNGADVASCKLISRADLSVPEKLGTLQRVPEDMQNDLQTLAKNQAASAGDDTVAPLSNQVGGKQTWGLYMCGPGAASAAAMPAASAAAPAASTGVKTLPYTPPR
ncbi:MAG TPA: hypothetical protein VGO35_07935 [Gammaproteobacteria bacterium]|jgi:hypothetical protein|nr:hypothetical protein [Gammaproteobacteria bacterium]